MEETNPILRLLKSSKGLVALVVITASFVAVFTGRASWDQMDSMVKWVLGVWMGSQALEDAATKIAAPKMLAAKHNVEVAKKADERRDVPTSLVPPG